LISNEFNRYFCNIGRTLIEKLNIKANTSFADYLKSRFAESIYLTAPPIKVSLINGLNIKKSTVYDDISLYILRVASEIIAPILCHLIELSFNIRIYPNSCKIAKVIPLYKSGNKADLSNYRPINLLTCFSKVYEKLLCERMAKFFHKHKVIKETQYGFQRNLSTQHAILNVITNVYDQIYNENDVA